MTQYTHIENEFKSLKHASSDKYAKEKNSKTLDLYETSAWRRKQLSCNDNQISLMHKLGGATKHVIL